MKLTQFDYELPDELIARYPKDDRAGSRLLVVDRKTGTWSDRMFPDLLEYLHPGDCLVLNDTKVIPARLQGKRASTGANIEVFLNQRMTGEKEIWHVLAGPARKAKPGEVIVFTESLSCRVISDVGPGEKLVEFESQGEFFEELSKAGAVPLPPYMKRTAEETDRERYQTVYARDPGAVAAPTAGLHFTPELLDSAKTNGAQIAHVTLHTGMGTFKPVEVEDIREHTMHQERYVLREEDAAKINRAKASGAKVFAVGTTTVRTLETIADENGYAHAQEGKSLIFIYPPYRFKVPDHIVTNFHMPRSTLLMMIAAFMGREFMLECYAHAIREQYRFYSYGDAMLIL